RTNKPFFVWYKPARMHANRPRPQEARRHGPDQQHHRRLHHRQRRRGDHFPGRRRGKSATALRWSSAGRRPATGEIRPRGCPMGRPLNAGRTRFSHALRRVVHTDRTGHARSCTQLSDGATMSIIRSAYIGLLATFATVTIAAAPSFAQQTKPNILVIMG